MTGRPAVARIDSRTHVYKKELLRCAFGPHRSLRPYPPDGPVDPRTLHGYKIHSQAERSPCRKNRYTPPRSSPQVATTVIADQTRSAAQWPHRYEADHVTGAGS